MERVLNRLNRDGMEKGWKGLKMAGHLMVATIVSPGAVSYGPTSLGAKPELDSCCRCLKWVKMSYFGGNMSKNGVEGF